MHLKGAPENRRPLKGVFFCTRNSWLEFQQQENKTQVEKSIDQHSHVAQQNMDTGTTPFPWIR